MAEPSNTSVIPSWVNEALRVGVVILGAVYVIGLLIINIDLGRYVLISVNLARPEYIMAGALWIFVTVMALGALMLAKDFLGYAWAAMRNRKPVDAVWNLFLVFGTVCVFETAFSLASARRTSFLISSTTTTALLTYSIIAYNALILYVTFKSISLMHKVNEPLSPRALFHVTYQGFTPFFSFIALIGVAIPT